MLIFYLGKQSPIAIIKNIYITLFCLTLVFIIRYSLFVYFHLTFIFHLHHELFPFFEPIFYFASLFWLKYYFFKAVAIPLLPLLMACHVTFMCSFFCNLGSHLEDFNSLIKISWQSYIF